MRPEIDPAVRQEILNESRIEDLKQAASKMQGEKRRSFQAEMTKKYCNGIARKAEEVFEWVRNSVALGLHEKRTGIVCLGGQKTRCGNKPWEEKHPEAAAFLFELAEADSQQDPSFQSIRLYTRLTAAQALKQLRNHGFSEEIIPSAASMANILNRNGYSLCRMLKTRPQKKFLKQTPYSGISRKKTAKALMEASPNG